MISPSLDADTEPAHVPPDPTRWPSPSEIFTHAFHLHQHGRVQEAEALYRAILATPSVHATAGYCLGHLCLTQERHAEAAAAFRQVLAIQSNHIDAMANLGTALLGLGKLEEAVEVYRHAIAIRPDWGLAYGNLGKALQDLGRGAEAVACYRQAIALEPKNATVWSNFGGALLEQKKYNDSVQASLHAITSDPANVTAYANLSAALLNLGAYAESLTACRRAMALNSHNGLLWSTLGGVLCELGVVDEAVIACRRAIDINPALPIAHFNLSQAHKALNRLPEAAASCRLALQLQQENPDYHFLLAHILLLQGDYDSGWTEYEWRWKLSAFAWLHEHHGKFAQPLWSGESLAGKTLLIYTEQGIGDVIMFARHLLIVVQMGGKVIVAAHQPLRRLLGCIEHITVVPVQEPLPHFDVHCPLLTLPRVLGSTIEEIPAEVPYLHVDPSAVQRWRNRIDPRSAALRVGIVWAGNPATQRDRFRSPGLANVAPLFAIPGVQFVILQVGPGREDLRAVSLPGDVVDVGAEVTDLVDTAAVMMSLDLIISSCTGPLHLAGALGRPTWAMIPFAPYFPWLTERDDTAWYPTMRLYRQSRPGGDWGDVVARIAADLTSSAASLGVTGFLPHNASPCAGSS